MVFIPAKGLSAGKGLGVLVDRVGGVRKMKLPCELPVRLSIHRISDSLANTTKPNFHPEAARCGEIILEREVKL